MNNDLSNILCEQVNDALNDKTPLSISAGGSKIFYGNKINAQTICTAKHKGILEYQPSELVVTVRSGTLLSELEAELKANKQMLAFEPPAHSDNSTIGGAIACGLSGPRRVACGSARDFVLGTNIINGRAEKCRFGGQVMKNVAGYDAARLMTGAQGTLGVLLDISIKVLPVSPQETSIKIDCEVQDAIKNLKRWVKQGIPISASCCYDNTLYIRLSSTTSAVKQSLDTINKQFSSEEIDSSFWSTIKNQTHDFFARQKATDAASSDGITLWRFSHNDAYSVLKPSEEQLFEWNGALCWLYSDNNLHAHAAKHQANATRFPLHNNDESEVEIFQPLQPGLLKIQKRLKQAFDPENILNPGRLYAEL